MMSNSRAGHVIVVFVATLLAAASSSVSAAGRESTSKFSGDESIQIAGYGEEKLSTVILTGALLCSSCSAHQLQLLPISGAVVAATCNSNDSPYKTGNKKPSWIVKAITTNNGEFMIDMPSYLHGIPDLDKACSVRVLRLPKHSPCRSAPKHGAHDIVLSSVGDGIRTYSAGTLHFENIPRGCKRESHGSY